MKHSPCWEASSRSASQEILHLSLKPKVYYRTRKIPPAVSIASRVGPVQAANPVSVSSALILFYLRISVMFRPSNQNLVHIFLFPPCVLHARVRNSVL
jgi:hypothetical protein